MAPKAPSMISSARASETVRARMKLKLLSCGKSSTLKAPGESDRDLGQLLAAMTVDQGGDAARNLDRGIQGADDADHQRDAEALDRARTEAPHRQAAEQRSDVGVGDRAGGLVVAGGDAGQRRVAQAQL